MEFKHIAYFVQTCDHTSFSQAAGSLFISQQALSRVIVRLEEELGCRLFTRTVKGVELTEDGKYLYERFQPVVAAFHDAVTESAIHFGNRPVRLPFCCGPGIIRNISPELLLLFSEQHPHIELEMIELSNVQCEEYIHADKRRFGLMVAAERKHRENHDYIRIKTEPTYLLVHKDNPLAVRDSVSLGMLKNERILTMDKTSYFLEDLNRAVEPFHFTVRPFYETADVTQQCGLVDKGIGVMLCIRQIFDESTCRNVVLVPLEERTFDYNIAFVFQDYSALDAKAKLLMQFIIDNIKKDSEDD